MTYNLDIAIIIAFLAINLCVGIYYGRNIKTIREYAIGDRNFSTATITATIIATWIGGSDFAIILSESYKSGLWFVFVAIGGTFNLVIAGYIFSRGIEKGPELYDSISVAEAMGKLYGKYVRFITAVCSIAASVAVIALQIKIFATVFTYFLGVSSFYATFVSSFVVIVYSAFGGIKSVTFTDVIQFITFGIVIPVFALFIWQVLGDKHLINTSLNTDTVFDYNALNFKSDFLNYFSIFLCMMIPMINPTIFQRMLMSKNSTQVKKSFLISALISLAFILITSFIALVLFAHNPNLNPNNLAMYVIDNYSVTGVKGLAIVGIMAMIMSTTDSWINASAVIFSHDICKPLGIEIKELLLSRIFAALIGLIAVFIALSSDNLLKLSFLERNVYLPIVTPPLMLTLLGFRTTTPVVLLAMFHGLATVIIWKMHIQPMTGIESVIPGMFANLITLFLAHYTLDEPGGWIKQNQDPLVSNKPKIRTFRNPVSAIHDFNFIDYFNKITPKNEMMYIYFAFSVMMTIVTTFLLDKTTYQQNIILINCLQATALFISTSFICNKLWPSPFREKYIGLIFYVSIFVGLAFISSFLTIISNFSQLSLVIFTLNLTVIGVLMSWRTSISMIIIGIFLASFSYQLLCSDSTNDITTEFYMINLKIVCILFMVTSFLIAFLKPKQEYQELTEEKVEHLGERISKREEELTKSLALKYEFLRNLQHEGHQPITSVAGIGELLYENYDKFTDKEKQEMIGIIAKSSDSLLRFVDNMIDVSKLSSMTYELNKTKVNISELVENRLEHCKKLYLNDKELGFVTNIEPAVNIDCDRHYITSTIDDLIINAIQYSTQGTIAITLTKSDGNTKFSITDQGIGIPKHELQDIFGEFVVSAKTKTPSGGRGVGLALCKKSIEAHGGKIWAESDGKSGARFVFVV